MSWQSETRPGPEERRDHGQSLRELAPRDRHGEWTPSTERLDPVACIEAQNVNRVPWLVPVRRARMAASAFAFFRGGARIMAHDLARTPVSGLTTQLCGDAHLSNFGAYASPERQLVFDINDFDQTLPGPWEWDVKRLAASLTIAGRHTGLGKKETRKLTRRAVECYRKGMAQCAEMRVTDLWYSLVEEQMLVEAGDSKRLRAAILARVEAAKRKTSRHALDKLAEEIDGEYRIRHDPPLLVPFRSLPDASLRAELHEVIVKSLEGYRRTVPHDVVHLLDRFRLVDAAVKVVGVGSVGTRCFILLFEGRDRRDPLFLQVKQADASVLEEHLPKSRYENSGRRVVEGQRLMQTVSDIFLGWTESEISGHDYYVRQLRDWKGSMDVDGADSDELSAAAEIRGRTLARDHARAGDSSAISGYLGSSEAFADAIAEFAERYADQNELDHAAFRTEIKEGRLESAELTS